MLTHKNRLWGEFSSHAFKNFCKQKEIQLEHTLPYSQQQNGVSERMNGTLMNKTRTLFVDTNLPKYLWGEAIRCAAYQLNRSPKTALGGKIPAEEYLGKLDLKRLRIFGCKAWACKSPVPSGKTEARATECRMVGYNKIGYRLWNPETDSIIVSPNVTFHETDFLYERKQVDNEVEKISTYEIYEKHVNELENLEVNQEIRNENQTTNRQESEEEEEYEEKKTRARNIKLPKKLTDYEVYSAYCLFTGEPETYREAIN